MASLYLLIPVALVLVAIALYFLLWAVNSQQYSDLDKEASNILFEEHTLTDNKGNEQGADRQGVDRQGVDSQGIDSKESDSKIEQVDK